MSFLIDTLYSSFSLLFFTILICSVYLLFCNIDNFPLIHNLEDLFLLTPISTISCSTNTHHYNCYPLSTPPFFLFNISTFHLSISFLLLLIFFFLLLFLLTSHLPFSFSFSLLLITSLSPFHFSFSSSSFSFFSSFLSFSYSSYSLSVNHPSLSVLSISLHLRVKASQHVSAT